MLSARIMFWNTLGKAIPPSLVLILARRAGAEVIGVAEPSGAFHRFDAEDFEKVTLPGRRALFVFHDDALEAVRTESRTIGRSGEAGCVMFRDGADELIVGFCHAQFTAGRVDGTDTANWMAEFETWLREIGADLYVGDTNMGSAGMVSPRLPRVANNTAILGDRATTNGGRPYDKGKILSQRLRVTGAGVILPERLRPAPSDGDQDDDKDPAGNFYIPMNGSEETIYRQSDHRPIYVDVEVEGAA